MTGSNAALKALIDNLRADPLDAESLDQVEAALREDGDFDALYDLYGDLARRIGDSRHLQGLRERAVRAFVDHADQSVSPAVASALLVRAGQLLEGPLERPTAAVAHYLDAFRTFPEPEPLDLAIPVVEQAGERDFARELWRARLEVTEGPADRFTTLMRIAALATEDGHLIEARGLLESARDLAQSPADAGAVSRAVERVASLLGVRTRRIDALREAARVARSEGERARALLRKAAVLDEGGPVAEDQAEARAARIEAFDAEPDNPAAFDAVERIYREEGAFAELAEVYQRVLADVYDPALLMRAHKGLGFLYLNELSEQRGRAPEHLRQALAIESTDVDVLRALAAHLRESGEHEELTTVLERLRSQTRSRKEDHAIQEEVATLRWLHLGDYEGAEKLFRRIRSNDRTNDTALAFFDDYHTQREDWRRLFATLETRLEVAVPAEVATLARRMARVASDHQLGPDKAIEAWSRVLEIEQSDDALAALVQLYTEAGRWHALLELLGERLESTPEDQVTARIHLLEQIADIYRDPSRLPVDEMLVKTLVRLLDLDPTRTALLDELAERYEALSRFAELARVLERRVVLTATDPERTPLHRRLAQLYLRRLNQPDAAIPHLRDVLEQDPTDLEAARALRNVYRAQKDIPNLVEATRHELAILEGEQRIPVLIELAVLYREDLADPQGTTACWEEVLELDPANERALVALSGLYDEAERWEDAARLLERRAQMATTRHRRVAILEQLAGLAADRLGDEERSRSALRAIAELRPHSAAARQTLHALEMERHSWQELRDQYEAREDWKGYLGVLDAALAAAETPEAEIEIRLELGRIYDEKVNNPRRATASLEAVLAADPEHVAAARLLVPRYEERRSWKKLAPALAVLAEHSPDGAEVREATERLVEVHGERLSDPASAFEWAARAVTLDAHEGVLGDLFRLLSLAEEANRFEDVVAVCEAASAALVGHDDALLQVELLHARVLRERLQRPEDAAVRYRQALEIDPVSDEALSGLEEVAIRASDWEGLEDTLWRRVRALLGRPESRTYLLRLGEVYEDFLDRPERAIDVYQRLRALDPRDTLAIEGGKRILEREERYPELAELMLFELELSEDEQGRHDLLIELGGLYADRLSAPERALTLWARVLEEDPANDEALGRVRGMLDDSELRAKAAAVLLPAYRRREDTEHLIEMLDVAVEHEEHQDTRLELEREVAHLLEQTPEGAVRAFDLYAEELLQRPESSELWGDLARTAERTDRWADLAELFGAATDVRSGRYTLARPLEDEPARLELLRRQAAIFDQRLGDAAAAVACYEEVLGHTPNDAELLQSMARLYRTLSDWECLLLVLRKQAEIETDRRRKKALLRRAAELVERELGRPREAADLLQAALTLDSADATVLDELVRLAIDTEDWESLADLLRHRIANAADISETVGHHIELANVLRHRLGSPQRAVDVLVAALALAPSDVGVRTALDDMLHDPDLPGRAEVAPVIAQAVRPIVEAEGDYESLVLLDEVRAELATDDEPAAAALLDVARVYAQRLSDPGQAFETLLRAFERAPGHPDVLSALQETATDLGAFGRLIECLEDGARAAASRGDREVEVALRLRAGENARDQLADAQLALQHFRAVLDIDPEQPAALLATDHLLDVTGNARDRIAILDRRARLAQGGARLDLVAEEGRLAHATGDAERAQRAFETILAEDTDAGGERVQTALDALEHLYTEAERWDDVVTVLDRKVAGCDDPGMAKVLLYATAGVYEDRLSRPADALLVYGRVLEMAPGDDVAVRATERLYEVLGSWERLEELFEEQRSTTPLGPVWDGISLKLARLYEEQLDRIGQALDVYDQVAERAPDENASQEAVAALWRLTNRDDVGFEATERLAGVYERTGNVESLLELRALQVDRFADRIDVPGVTRVMALLCESRIGDHERAFELLSQAFRAAPDSDETWSELCRVGEKLDRPGLMQGVVLDVRAEVSDPARRSALAWRAAEHVREQGGDAEEMAALFWLVVEDEPDHLPALDRLEDIYADAEQWDRLIEVLARKVEHTDDPAQRVVVLYQIGSLLQGALGRDSEAVEHYEHILRIDPLEYDAYYQMEAIYARADEWDDVARVLLRALEVVEQGEGGLEDEIQRLTRRLCEVLYDRRGEYELALGFAAELLAIDPTDPVAERILGGLYEREIEPRKVAELLLGLFEAGGQWKQAIALLDAEVGAASTASERVALLERLAEIQRDKLHDPEAAYTAARRLAAVDPTPERLDAVERAAERRQAWTDLEKLYSSLAESVPDDAMKVTVGLRLADLRERRLNDPFGAAMAFRAVLTRDERNRLAAESLERLFRRMERWEDLVELFEQMALISESKAERVELYLKAANLWDEFLGRPERSVDDLKRVLEQDPANRDALTRCERIHLRTSAFIELQELYRGWCEVEEEPARVTELRYKLAFLLADHLDSVGEALDQLALIFEATPGYPAAVRYLESLLERLPGVAPGEVDFARLQVARLLEAQYKPDTPWQRWVRVLETELNHSGDDEERAVLLIRLGELLRDKAADPETALLRFGDALRLEPGDEALEETLEDLAVRAESPELLRDLYLELSEEPYEPSVRERYLLRAATLIDERMGDLASAAPHYARYLELHPDHQGALSALERHHRDSGDEAALAAVLELRAEGAMDPAERAKLLMRTAALREKTGEPAAAIEHYRSVLALDEHHTGAYDRLEALLSDAKDWVSLVALYRARLTGLDKADARIEILGRLAQVFERYLGRVDEAVLCYREIFDLNSNNLYAITSLERLYPVVEQWDELLDVLNHKRELFAPRDKIEIDFQIGRLYQDHLGSVDRAIDYYRLVLQRNDHHEGTVAALEELLRQADYAFNASLVIEPVYEATEQWRSLARLYALQLPYIDDPGEKISLYLRSAELYEQKLSEPAQAIATLAVGLRQDYSHTVIRTQMAEIADRHDLWQTVTEKVSELLDEVRDADVARELNLWLAKIHEERTGDPESAIVRYRRVLDFDEFHAEALSSLERLLRAAERWADLANLLTRKVANTSGTERAGLRLRIAEITLDRLDDPDAALSQLTELLYEKATRERALEMLERLAGRHPNVREEALDILSPIYQKTERWDRLANLIDLCQQAVADPMRRAELRRTLGGLYRERLDEPGLAFTAYADALADDPTEALVLLPSLLDLAEQLDRWEDLADALDRGEQSAAHVDARLRSTLLLRSGEIRLDRLKDPLSAEARLLKVTELDPQSAQALEMLERLYDASGRHADLIAICERRAELPLSVDERKRLYAKMANAARIGRDATRAIDAYRRVLELDASDPDALRMLELLFENKGDHGSLAAVLERQASLPGRATEEMADLRIRLGRLREDKLHDLEGAVESYEEALELSPGHADAMAALERLYEELEMWEQLRNVLERQVHAAANDNARLGLYHRLARLHERQLNDVEGAIDYNQRALDVDRNSADAINELVRLFHKHGRWRELVALYDAKIVIAQAGAERMSLLVKSAEIYERYLDDPEKAMDNLQEVLEHEPEHVYALKVLARLKERHGDWLEAVEILEQLLPHVNEAEERIDVLVKLGKLYAEQGDDEEGALDAFAQAIELNPNHRAANEALRGIYKNRGAWGELIEVIERQVEWTTGDKEKAALYREMALIYRDKIQRKDHFLRWIEKAHELRPDDPETKKALLGFYESVQDFEQMAPLLEWMVAYLEHRRMFQHVPRYAHRLGLTLERLGERERALHYYRLAYKQDATYFPNLLAYGRLLIRLGKFEQALIIYQAMQLQQHDAPDDVKIEIFFNLGQICMKLGDPKKAKQYFQRLLRIDKSHGPTLDILAKLG